MMVYPKKGMLLVFERVIFHFHVWCENAIEKVSFLSGNSSVFNTSVIGGRCPCEVADDRP